MFSSNFTITEKKNYYKKDNKKTCPIKIQNTHSSNPHIPDSPPLNTPPNLDFLREIYLNYLTKINKK